MQALEVILAKNALLGRSALFIHYVAGSPDEEDLGSGNKIQRKEFLSGRPYPRRCFSWGTQIRPHGCRSATFFIDERRFLGSASVRISHLACTRLSTH